MTWSAPRVGKDKAAAEGRTQGRGRIESLGVQLHTFA